MIQVTGMVITDEDKLMMIDAITSGEVSFGKYNHLAEKALAKYEGKKHALLVNSGSSANLLALMAIKEYNKNRPQYGEVITLAASFPTTIAPIVQAGFTPVFVDIDETYNIDVTQLKRALSSKTIGVMIAHTLGIPFDIDTVIKFCDDNHLFLIADCCDALGSMYKGKKVTSFNYIVTNSFYPAHHITSGEGGAVLCDGGAGDEYIDIVHSLRDWGRACKCDPGKDNACGKRFEGKFGELPEGYDHKYVYNHFGYNLKMTNVQAALLYSQLKRVDEYRNIRRENFNIIFDHLSQWTFPIILKDGTWTDYSSDVFGYSEPSWFGYPICLPDNVDRDRVVRELNSKGIMTRLLFAGNITKQPLGMFNYRMIGNLPMTNRIMNQMFWIGCWHGLSHADVEYEATTTYNVIKGAL